jgi:ABC-type transport system involved in multi-copper enzyme maturation permease subunit
MNYVKRTMTLLGRVFGGDTAGNDAWIDTEAPLTPREARIRRMTQLLQWSAILNGAAWLVLMLLFAAGAFNPQSLSSILLGGYSGDSATAVLLSMTGLALNVSLLLTLMMGTQAQEFWSLPVLLALLAGNAAGLILLQFWPGLLTLLPLAYLSYLVVQDVRAFHGNAVMLKELRGRMRGIRAFAIISVFLLLMGSFTVLLYLLQLPRVNSADTIVTGELGRLLFMGVVGIELLLIIFIVPALTAGAISGERERQTYDLLQTTLLSAPSFILGKLESALSYIVLLLLSAIPLQSIAFIFGGVSQTEVLLAFVLLMVSALALGGLGMYFSAQTERTLTATIRVYMVAFGLIALPYFLSGWLFGGAYGEVIAGSTAFQNSAGVTAAQEAVTIYGDMLLSNLSPILSALQTQEMLINQQQIFLMDVQLASTGEMLPVLAPWLVTTILYTGLMALALALAVRRMRRSV